MVNINWDKVTYKVFASVYDGVNSPLISEPQSSGKEAAKVLLDLYETAWERASSQSKGLRSQVYVGYDFRNAVELGEDAWDDPNIMDGLSDLSEVQVRLGVYLPDQDEEELMWDKNLAYVTLFDHYYDFSKLDGDGDIDIGDLEEALEITFGI